MKPKPVGGYLPSDLEDMPTLCVGQCCSLKIDGPRVRVWLCRSGGGVSIERYDPQTERWRKVEGDCYPTYE